MEKNKTKLNNIKSIYILKSIFNYISSNVFLYLLCYNKEMQKKLEISIEDYKKFGNKFKNGERNGMGKEYKLNKNILLFEGEYLNGKKNGKGKEYYKNGRIKFEGTYFKGKKIEGIGYDSEGNQVLKIEKSGFGIELYKNNRTNFKGEYFNGKRWNGKGYNFEGIEEYEIKYGIGVIKEYEYNGKLIYEGDYRDRKRNGKGKEYIFINDIVNEPKRNSFFEFRNLFYFYSHYERDMNFFDETYDNEVNKENERKVSIIKNGNNALIFEGEYYNGERNGFGKEYYHNNQLKFEGEYLNGNIWFGKGYDNRGNKEYEIKNGKGYIKEYDNGGKFIFEGEYLNGERNGIGKEYFLIKENSYYSNPDNIILKFEGEYLNVD